MPSRRSFLTRRDGILLSLLGCVCLAALRARGAETAAGPSESPPERRLAFVFTPARPLNGERVRATVILDALVPKSANRSYRLIVESANGSSIKYVARGEAQTCTSREEMHFVGFDGRSTTLAMVRPMVQCTRATSVERTPVAIEDVARPGFIVVRTPTRKVTEALDSTGRWNGSEVAGDLGPAVLAFFTGPLADLAKDNGFVAILCDRMAPIFQASSDLFGEKGRFEVHRVPNDCVFDARYGEPCPTAAQTTP